MLSESTRAMTIWVICGCEGVGDIPGIQGGFRGVCQFCTTRLDCHKNSDLGSEVRTSTSLNSTSHCLIESVALLTKSIGIVTPLILSIVVVVALRLISYKTWSRDCIVQESASRSYHTWASVKGGKRNEKEAVQCICVVVEVQSKHNITL